MTITPGYYRTRGGNKARVLCTDAEGPHPIIGYICHEGRCCHASWAWNGVAGSVRGPLDLVARFDAPKVDWSNERVWVKALAMDSSGVWYRFDAIPTIRNKRDEWYPEGSFYQELHPTEYPPFTGDWKDSLCVTPEEANRET